MIPNANILDILSPTPLEVSFIEKYLFYVVLDQCGEAITDDGYVYQKTKKGAEFIHGVAEILQEIADKDEIFMKRVENYHETLMSCIKPKNEALATYLDKRVDNFRTVNRQAKGGDEHKS